MLSKLGRASRPCAGFKVEDVQGAVSVTRDDCVAIPSGSHAGHIAPLWVLVQCQGLVGLQDTQLDLSAK